METDSFDAIVVGGGPGGSSCAALLGKQGFNVLLLEKSKYPRDKICGDAISGKSMSVLRDLGLEGEVRKLPHGKTHGVIFSSPKKDVVQIPFRRDGKRVEGVVCRRMFFDNLVFGTAKKYAHAIEEFAVTDIIQENGFVTGVKGTDLKSKKAMEFRAKIVIGADGAQSIVAKKLGLLEQQDKHHCTALRAYYSGIEGMSDNIELHFIDSVLPGYFWIFPLENGNANVGVGVVTAEMKKKNINIKQAMLNAIESDSLLKDRFRNAKMEGDIKGWTLPFGSIRRKAHGNGFVLIGDAASLIDPFSGEGIGNAMHSGRLAARIVGEAIKANDVSEKFLSEYEDTLWNEIGTELKNSYNLQRIGNIKPILNFVIRKAATKKEVQELISGMLSNEEAKKELFSPLFYLKLLLP